jgi:hypothetical protein
VARGLALTRARFERVQTRVERRNLPLKNGQTPQRRERERKQRKQRESNDQAE